MGLVWTGDDPAQVPVPAQDLWAREDLDQAKRVIRGLALGVALGLFFLIAVVPFCWLVMALAAVAGRYL